MIEIYTEDHRAEAIAELPSYHRSRSIVAFLSGIAKGIQDLEDRLYDLKVERLLERAVGPYLEQYGSIVEEVRGGLRDEDYRRIIRAKIPACRSTGKPSDIYIVAGRLFEPATVKYFPLYPAGYSLLVSTDNPPEEDATLDYDARDRMRDMLSGCSGTGIAQEVVLTSRKPFSFGSCYVEDETLYGFDSGELGGIL